MSEKLAVLGGSPVIARPFAAYRSMRTAEVAAVAKVVDSGTLSGFFGSWGEEFLGGPVVKAFEHAWAERFKVAHAVSMNAATSGLIAAMGAVGVTPGSEVIVPPYTMSATAIAPLVYGGIPVFVDIDPDTFTLDLGAVRDALTAKTKAILAVNLFGHPARLAELRKLADEHGCYLIEDNAQAILAKEGGKLAGTVGHIGVFSLNYHKHIHTGEGGVCTTDDPSLALRLQMIRNHAENIVEPVGMEDPSCMIGFNFRMTEMSAAVGIEQLARVDEHVERRVRVGRALSEAAEGLEGLTPARARAGCTHAYYVWTVRINEARLGISRETFSRALAAEGFPNAAGYVRPLYLLPLFQKRIAFGNYPFNLTERTYPKGLCPVTERMHEHELLSFETCANDLDAETVRLLGSALRKVHQHRHELRTLPAGG